MVAIDQDRCFTFEEIGAALFAEMRTDTQTSLACPFGNGLAEFIGRNNDSYARKFCQRGCSCRCYWEMIEENRRRYETRIHKIEEVQ